MAQMVSDASASTFDATVDNHDHFWCRISAPNGPYGLGHDSYRCCACELTWSM
jgi:hypothetical protein